MKGLERLINTFALEGRVTIDSRRAGPGDIFFGLPGSRVNGGIYAPMALAQGAELAVVSRGSGLPPDDRIVEVPNVLDALTSLARWHRERLNIPVLGITGSSGKTTTKELLVAALSAEYRVAATEGNLNNEIGLPLSLLSVKLTDQIAVLEMGASKKGDIAYLCEIARPTHGLITSIGRAHLAGFGDIEGVASAKGELFAYLKRHEGTGFVRLDDDHIAQLATELHLGCSGVGYSLASYGVECEQDSEGLLTLRIASNGQKFTLNTHLVGEYNAINIVAALHVAYFFNVPLAEACAEIATYQPGNHRSQLVRTVHNRVIADCYNANPSSMLAAIGSFRGIGEGRGMLILGDMLELGDASEALHREVMETAESVTPGMVYYVGEEFAKVAPPARSFPNAMALKEYLYSHPIRGKRVLVKGSHGIKLETVLEML